MLFRTPGRTSLIGLALAATLAMHLRPAFVADVAAFRAALSRPQEPPVVPATEPPPEPSLSSSLLVDADSPDSSDPGDAPDADAPIDDTPFHAARPEPAYARLGAAVLPLVYRVEPDEEPLLPQPAPPEEVLQASQHLQAGLRPSASASDTARFLPVLWEADAIARIEPAAGVTAFPTPAASTPATPRPLPTATPIALPTRPHPQDLARAAYAALDAGALGNAARLFDMALSAQPSGQLAADLAYTRLRLGQSREAAKAFELALRLGPATPEAGALWQREANRLNDRFSLQAYTFLRADAGRPSAQAFGTTAPGQSQSALLFQARPDPFARRPLLLVGRLLAAHQGTGESPLLRSAQATAGVGWLAVPAINGTVVAERWVRLGDGSRSAWALRAHGGYGEGYGPSAAETAGETASWLHWSVYGETAVIGAHRRDLYAGGEARAGYGYALGPKVRATLTGALWAQAQHDDRTRHRIEAGPSLGLEATLGQVPLHLRLDYRIAVSATRAAGSGATLTVAAGF